MADSLLKQLMSRGEGFFTEVSNNLMSNPAFIEVLKKGIAAKELVDEQVAQGLKRMNVATRKDIKHLEQRVAALEAAVEKLGRSRPAGRRKKAAGEE